MPLTAHGEQSALRSHPRPTLAASTAPLPASVTIMIRPSGGVGCESSRSDLGRWQQIFFGKSENKDSTAPSTNRPTGKSPHGARANSARVPDAVQRPSRCSAEPGPQQIERHDGPRISKRTTPQVRRAAQHPGNDWSAVARMASAIRDRCRVNPGFRFAHPGYACCCDEASK